MNPTANKPDRPDPNSWKTGFGRRLGIFLIGVVIGLLLLTMFRMAKNAAGTP